MPTLYVLHFSETLRGTATGPSKTRRNSQEARDLVSEGFLLLDKNEGRPGDGGRSTTHVSAGYPFTNEKFFLKVHYNISRQSLFISSHCGYA